MLPNFLQSKYLTYKEDTDLLAKWLAVNAKQCGYPPDLVSPSDPPTPSTQPNLPSQRPKGARRKQGKHAGKENAPPTNAPKGPTGAPKYTIKVKDFTAFAECIARFNKPAVKVPLTVVHVLNRAINLRQQHHTWSRAQPESAASTSVEESNQSHAHFLGILEHTREVLRPRMPPETIDDFLSKPSLGSRNQATSETQINGQISNMFDSLDIQEPSQEFLDAPDVERATIDKAAEESNYEVERLQSIEEQYMATHCLFQDLSNIRSFLRQLWTSYKDGEIALVAASITANTAIDFVRSMEQDLLQRFPDKTDYESIMRIFYGPQCINRGINPSSKQRPDDPFNFEVYDLAEAVMIPTYIVLESLQRVIFPNQLPIYRPGHLGTRDTTTAWAEKSDREKFRDDRLALMEAFPDLMLTAIMTSRFSLAEDELIRGVRQMAPGEIIPLWLVFAAQCFLDTQHVLGRDVGRGHTELQRTGNAIKASITQNLKFHESLRVENWPTDNDTRFSGTLTVIEEWIRQDLVATKMKTVGAARALPSPEPFRLLKQYPLLCGLWSFAVQMNAHGLGIDFANAWGSIMYASHLYNATREEKLLSKPWKDMELLIALQSTERLFVGNTPKDPEAYFKRFILSMGYSSTVFASNRRRNASIASARGPRGLSELCTAGTLFRGRYCRNEHSVNWTTESMQSIIAAKMDDDSDGEHSGRKGSSKVKVAASGTLIKRPKRMSKAIPTVHFLRDLAHALHAETLELSVDYLRMHRSCWMLLRKVNEACKPQLLESIGAGYLEQEYQLPFVVGYIFMVATQTNGVANLLLPRRPGVQVSSRLLAKAAEAIKDMIDSGVGEIEIKFLTQRSGIGEINFCDLDGADVRG